MANKNYKVRVLSVALSAAVLCAGGVAAGLSASAKSGDDAAPAVTSAATAVARTADTANTAAQKNETVYVIAGADGTVKKLIVSDHLKNNSGDKTLSDKSGLSGIENVRGDEQYSSDGGMLVWDADGHDIYYQGTTDKALPVGMKISYTLDGKVTDAASLAGRSGHLVMRIDYKNYEYETVEIDGGKQKIYVPFAMLTGMLLDNDVFSNIQVSNGKLISDGDRTVVVGLALPGLQSNLGIENERFEIPSHVEISADVVGFRMTNTVTVATNELFNRADVSGFDKVDELELGLGELCDGVRQLVDGSSALYDGVATLLDKSGELVEGINKLAGGAQTLKEGSGKLLDGSGELSRGASELADGLKLLASSSGSLNQGAEQVFNTLLATADAQLASAGLTLPSLTISNYRQVLTGAVGSLDESAVRTEAERTALTRVTEQVKANRSAVEAGVTAAVRSEVESQVTAAVREQVLAGVLSANGMTPDYYREALEAGAIPEAIQQAIESAVAAQMASESIQATIAAQIDAQMATEQIQSTISSNVDAQIQKLIDDNMASEAVQSQIEAAVAQASAGSQSIKQLISQLDSYNEFYCGLAEYTSGVGSASYGADKLEAGAKELAEGASALDSGVDQLLAGILTLKDGAPALIDGIAQLRDGSMQLRDGLRELDERGIQALTEAVGGDLAGLAARIRATTDVSRDYTAFSGISDDMQGSVRFIFRTDSIK